MSQSHQAMLLMSLRSQSASETTGEHTAIMLAPLEHPDVAGGHKWVDAFVRDFKVSGSG
jgi:tRNA(Met) C34 N-acetyltransferase TmcA